MQLNENILNQFISPHGSYRQLVELKLQQATKQYLDFFSDADNKPTYPEFKNFGNEYFKIPMDPSSENQIQVSLQEL